MKRSNKIKKTEKKIKREINNNQTLKMIATIFSWKQKWEFEILYCILLLILWYCNAIWYKIHCEIYIFDFHQLNPWYFYNLSKYLWKHLVQCNMNFACTVQFSLALFMFIAYEEKYVIYILIFSIYSLLLLFAWFSFFFLYFFVKYIYENLMWIYFVAVLFPFHLKKR